MFDYFHLSQQIFRSCMSLMHPLIFSGAFLLFDNGEADACEAIACIRLIWPIIKVFS
jgi:hypothetical protein